MRTRTVIRPTFYTTTMRSAGRVLLGLVVEEDGQVNGTKDKDYNVIWLVEQLP